MKYFFPISFLILFSIKSFAETRIGNGGEGVACFQKMDIYNIVKDRIELNRDAGEIIQDPLEDINKDSFSLRLLDIYPLNQSFPYQEFSLEKLKNDVPFFHYITTKYSSTIQTEQIIYTTKPLLSYEDHYNAVELPKNCLLLPIAIHYSLSNDGETLIKINRDLFTKLTRNEQTLLLLHEKLYSLQNYNLALISQFISKKFKFHIPKETLNYNRVVRKRIRKINQARFETKGSMNVRAVVKAIYERFIAKTITAKELRNEIERHSIFSFLFDKNKIVTFFQDADFIPFTEKSKGCFFIHDVTDYCDPFEINLASYISSQEYKVNSKTIKKFLSSQNMLEIELAKKVQIAPHIILKSSSPLRIKKRQQLYFIQSAVLQKDQIKNLLGITQIFDLPKYIQVDFNESSMIFPDLNLGHVLKNLTRSLSPIKVINDLSSWGINGKITLKTSNFLTVECIESTPYTAQVLSYRGVYGKIVKCKNKNGFTFSNSFCPSKSSVAIDPVGQILFCKR